MEKPSSLCSSCTHRVDVRGDGFEIHGCSSIAGGGSGFYPLKRNVTACSNYFRKNSLDMYTMNRLAYIPDDEGRWKKPDRKAGFYIEEPEGGAL